MAAFIPYAFAAYGAISQGQQQKDAAGYNAAANEQYAQVGEREAASDEQQQRKNAQLFLGNQAAARGESGLSGPSSDAVAKQSSMQAELDALNIRYHGAIKAYGLRTQGRQDIAQGNAAAGQQYQLAGSQLLKGVASYYGK